MKIVKFAPKNKFYADIMSGAKRQTIRPKPIEVGTKIALWEMVRGMKKGKYCPKLCDVPNAMKSRYSENCALCGLELVQLPRFIKASEITECIQIEMMWVDEDGVLDIKINGEYSQSIEPTSPLGQSDFVAKDTPSWSNEQFIEFFLNAYPQITKGFVPFWIWKW